jgi:hypothetical protein
MKGAFKDVAIFRSIGEEEKHPHFIICQYAKKVGSASFPHKNECSVYYAGLVQINTRNRALKKKHSQTRIALLTAKGDSTVRLRDLCVCVCVCMCMCVYVCVCVCVFACVYMCV